MARPRVLPADSELVAMRDRGMTHQQIADEVTRRTGHKVARSTISVALHRAGEASVRHRYSDTVPWTVGARFGPEYQLRMLRLLGRQRDGVPMTDDESKRLTSWLDMLTENNWIVGFCPDAPDGEPGFHYLPAAAKDHDDDVPIRRTPVAPSQIGY